MLERTDQTTNGSETFDFDAACRDHGVAHATLARVRANLERQELLRPLLSWRQNPRLLHILRTNGLSIDTVGRSKTSPKRLPTTNSRAASIAIRIPICSVACS